MNKDLQSIFRRRQHGVAQAADGNERIRDLHRLGEMMVQAAISRNGLTKPEQKKAEGGSTRRSSWCSGRWARVLSLERQQPGPKHRRQRERRLRRASATTSLSTACRTRHSLEEQHHRGGRHLLRIAWYRMVDASHGWFRGSPIPRNFWWVKGYGIRMVP